MRLQVYDPYVAPETARRLGADVVSDLQALLADADFVSIHVPRTRRTEGLLDAEALGSAKPGMRLINTSRGGIVDEDALVEAIRSGRIAGAALDVFSEEPLTTSPLFDLPEVVVTPHLGATTIEAQDKAGTDVAAAVIAALAGELVTGAVNIDIGPEVSDEVRSFLPLAEKLGDLFVAVTGGLPPKLLVRVEGRLADYPARPLALAALKGALSRVSDRPVSFVNAPALAADRGVRLLEEATSEAADFQSVIRVSGVVGDEMIAVAGTLFGRKGPVLVEVFDHEIELPFSRNMVVMLSDDVPGVIGAVGTYLGDRGINIDNMVHGRSHVTGESAVMGLNLDRALTGTEADELAGVRGVNLAIFIESD
jgi:D-3-phosphoglycerate dehydrogenase